MMRQSINKTIATLVVASLGVFSLSTIARQDETQRQIVQQAIKAKKSCCSTFWLDYNMRVAVAVGFIALAGVAAETDVIMLIYLDHAYQELKAQRDAEGKPFAVADLYRAVMEGAVERVRPKMMTVV